MKALAARLAKLEGAVVQHVTGWEPTKSLQQSYDDVIAFAALPVRQQLAELRSRLAEPIRENPAVPGLAQRLETLRRTDTFDVVAALELDLLAELGYPNAKHPLTDDLREHLEIALFDA